MDVIAWECDYPHTDTTWPDSPEFSWSEFEQAGCTGEEIHKITWQNATRFFDWDPFAQIEKEQANVGSLRALARRRRHHPHAAGRMEEAQRGCRHRRLLTGRHAELSTLIR